MNLLFVCTQKFSLSHSHCLPQIQLRVFSFFLKLLISYFLWWCAVMSWLRIVTMDKSVYTNVGQTSLHHLVNGQAFSWLSTFHATTCWLWLPPDCIDPKLLFIICHSLLCSLSITPIMDMKNASYWEACSLVTSQFSCLLWNCKFVAYPWVYHIVSRMNQF